MAKRKYDAYGLVEKKCKKCGKIFVPAPLHRYRDERSGYYCSWTCYNHRKDPKTGGNAK